jgi:hypothetical protein
MTTNPKGNLMHRKQVDSCTARGEDPLAVERLWPGRVTFSSTCALVNCPATSNSRSRRTAASRSTPASDRCVTPHLHTRR